MTDSKDWTGNKASVYKTLAASNHSNSEREKNDFYATDPKAIDLLLEKEKFSDLIWEPACGQGHLSKRLEQNGYEVLSTDLIDRGFGIAGVNFLNQGSAPAGCDLSQIRRLLCWFGWHEWCNRCDYPFCKLPMCGDVSHYCPQCRGYEKEICKHCGKVRDKEEENK